MTQSHGDINFSLAAYGIEQRQIPGQFIYVKEAAQPVIIRVNGQGVLMRAGDKSRYVLPFDTFEVENPNGSAVSGVLVVGQGDYNRIIVSGQITAATGILTASGKYEPDTTRELSLAVWPRPNYSPRTVAANSVQATGFAPPPSQPLAFGWGADTWFYADVQTNIFATDGGGQSYAQVGTLNTNRCHAYALTGADAAHWVAAGVDYQNSNTLWLFWSNGVGAGAKPSGRSVTLGTAWMYGQMHNASFDPWANEVIFSDGLGSGSVVIASVDQPAAADAAATVIETAFDTVLAWDADTYLCMRYNQGYSFVPKVKLGSYATYDYAWPAGWSELGRTGTGPERLYYWETGTIYQFAATEINYTNSLRITPAKCGGGLLSVSMKDGAQFIENTASVTLTNNANGSVTLKGEVVRAALAAFLGGAPVPSDYLDHVTGIKATPQGAAQWGGAWVDTQTGGETFAAAAIADDFTVTLPGQITITADASI